MPFKPIETQEELDRIIQERLNRQKETIEKQYADYDELKTQNATLASENATLKTSIEDSTKKTENYDKDIAELNAKIAGYETANIRTRIALQHGLSYELANRLVGDDENSITEDAKKLAELVKVKDPVPPLKNIEPNIDGKDGAYKSLLENLNLEGE